MAEKIQTEASNERPGKGEKVATEPPKRGRAHKLGKFTSIGSPDLQVVANYLLKLMAEEASGDLPKQTQCRKRHLDRRTALVVEPEVVDSEIAGVGKR